MSGDFKQKVIQVASGAVLGQGLVILSTPVLTRLYTTEQFGDWTLFTFTLGIVAAVGAWRLESALPIPKDEGEAQTVLGLCLTVVLFNALLLSGLILVLGKPFTAWLRAPGLFRYLWLLPLALIGEGFTRVLMQWALRVGAFKEVARVRFSKGAAQVLLQIVCFKTGSFGLLLGDTGGRLSGCLRLGGVPVRGGVRTSQWRLRDMMAMLSRFRRFPLLGNATTFVNMLNRMLPAMLIARYFGRADVGLYGLAFRVMALPGTFIAEAVAQVYLSEFARIHREDPGALMTIFWATIRRMLIMGLPAVGLIVLLGPFAIRLVYGEAYAEAGVLLALMAPMILLDIVSYCVGSTLDILERQDLTLVRELLRMVLVMGGLIIAGVEHLSLRGTVACLGIFGGLSYGTYGVFAWWAIRQHIRELEQV